MTPDKYKAKTRPWETKAWLYEQYWGELKSTRRIARETGITRKKLRYEMEKHGIPSRTHRYGEEYEISPFSGFYRGRPAPTLSDSEQKQTKEIEQQASDTPDWGKAASQEKAQ